MSQPDGILVNHGAVDQAAQDLTTAIDRSITVLDEFLTKVRNEQEHFTGEAATYYARKTAEWQTILNDLQTLGKLTSGQLVDSNQRFMETDKKTAAMFDSMNVGY